MPASPSTSPPVFAATFVAVMVLAAVALAAGAPLGPVIIAASGIGTALILRWRASRSFAGAERQEPGGLDRFPVRLAAERYAVGRLLQVRLFPPTSRVWAPGVLGVSRGEVRFVPSSARHADRSWSARPTSVEVHQLARASVVRIHAPDGSAQFAIQLPPDDVRAHIAPLLPVGN